ncbi:unnamed protein product [Dovyalis caffra]|uniref:Uncharacterized protein n=1 Tax=Dovyalis caffra TaxID=77055 RepID=A0AAV1R993_9ROSI|nr:unnamed protein product [Dovyalis caffra]
MENKEMQTVLSVENTTEKKVQQLDLNQQSFEEPSTKIPMEDECSVELECNVAKELERLELKQKEFQRMRNLITDFNREFESKEMQLKMLQENYSAELYLKKKRN